MFYSATTYGEQTAARSLDRTVSPAIDEPSDRLAPLLGIAVAMVLGVSLWAILAYLAFALL